MTNEKDEDHSYMTKLLAGCGAALVGVFATIFFICITTIGGIIIGWVVGLFFSETCSHLNHGSCYL